jgi:geranylgeranyl pyrophosphate synthase
MFSPKITALKQEFEGQMQQMINNLHLPANLQYLTEQMSYVLINSGKRMRPLLHYATSMALNQPLLHYSALSLEVLHCYSLIHDDLPAMDNDDYRHGKLTAHKQFGEAAAILLGDGLQSLAFELLTQEQVTDKAKVLMISEFAQAIGIVGMVGGQSLDINQKYNDLEQLIFMHSLKTGKLIELSVKLAILGANVSLSDTKAVQLLTFAQKIGLCFQIQDDILDVTAGYSALGKTPGKDLLQNKKTFVSLLGLPAAANFMNTTYQEALECLQGFDNAQMLQEIATVVVKRKY